MGSKVIRNVTKILKATSGRLFGRVTAGTGRAEELTPDDVRTLLEVATTSQIAAAYQPIGSYQATLVSGTNIKTVNSTSLLGSGDIVVSALPAGSSGQVQFNSAGAFGGATAVVYAATVTHIVVTAQGATIVPLCLKGAASQSGNYLEVRNSSDTILTNIQSDGSIQLRNAASQVMRIAMTTNNPIIGSTTGQRFIVSGASLQLQATGGTVEFTNTDSSVMASAVTSGFNFTIQSNTNGSLTLQIPTSANSNQGANAISIIGQSALSSSTNIITGGQINITGGNGASASAGNARGGDVVIRGGIGYGTGRVGLVIMSNLPTSNPGVTGALWNDAGTLKIS
jgi:hypothetical protein